MHKSRESMDRQQQAMQEKVTEQQIKELGFTLTKTYPHDQFHTRRYGKGVLQVEFTYEGSELLTFDLTIWELCRKVVTLEQMKVLTAILT